MFKFKVNRRKTWPKCPRCGLRRPKYRCPRRPYGRVILMEGVQL